MKVNTAQEVIDFIGSRNEVYEIKFGLADNLSRIYDIKELNKTTIPGDILSLFIKKSRANPIPNRFVLQGEELELFKKYIKDTDIYIGVHFGVPKNI